MMFSMLLYIKTVINSQEYETLDNQELKVCLDLDKIRLIDIEEFRKKSSVEKHEIAKLIEKEYQPFGKLFEKEMVIDGEYYKKIMKILSGQEINDLLDEAFEEELKSEKLDDLQSNELDSESELIKNSKSDDLLFSLFKNDIQIHHYDFAKLLSNVPKINQENFFLFFFYKRKRSLISHREKFMKHFYINLHSNQELRTIEECNADFIESYENISNTEIDYSLQNNVDKLKKQFDNELKKDFLFLETVFKNDELRNEILSFFVEEKSKSHSKLYSLREHDYDYIMEEIKKYKNLKEKLFFYLTKRRDWEVYKYYYILSEPVLRIRILKMVQRVYQ